MSDAGESSHKRSKSAALSLLRRKPAPDDDMISNDGGLGAQPPSMLASTATTATSPASIAAAHQHQAVRGHSSRLSTAGSVMGRTPSYQAPASVGGSKSASNLTDRGVSLESSVKKFRIVEALRNGDTASISKAIRDTADTGPRASTSSFSTQSGALEDTTILHLAIQCAEQPVVEYVLSNGAGSLDVNARDKDGNTPLHIAASQGRSQVVRLLLEQKDINDAIANHQGRLPIDLARNPDIFQQLQLSRSLFAENKIRQVQDLILHGEFKVLEQVLEEPRFKTILDINSTEFASDPITVQAGGTLLHEAARRKNTHLIQVLLLHGADPFRRDRKGKLPQDVTKDEVTRAMLKKSPAAVAAQRGIQEKAVLGSTSQGVTTSTPGDPLAGREAREMKGYLKKWTNYRKGYQLRWFVLEDGVLSYYKHQDDAGSACRGAINMRIARLHMSADEKTKFEIIGKSSVKYTLKANHEVEAKRWFWALNNSIQWTKDQAKEDEKQRARSADLLKQAKAELSHGTGASEVASESASIAEPKRNSFQLSRMHSSTTRMSNKVSFAGASTTGSNDDDDFVEAGTEADRAERNGGQTSGEADDDDDDDYGEGSSGQDAPVANKDAFSITAQSAKLQLDTMALVTSALLSESTKNPNLTLSDPKATQALSTYDAAIHSLTGLIGDLLRISKDRDAYWQYRLDRESEMRRMWEESMAQVAKEQEALEARVGEAEEKRKITKRILKEALGTGMLDEKERPITPAVHIQADGREPADEEAALGPLSPALSLSRRQTMIDQVVGISEDETDEEEFFDAVDAGEVEVSQLPPSEVATSQDSKQLVISDTFNMQSSFRGYESGIRTRLKMDADDRPKISLWGILKSMIGKDMTKMTLPVSFNEPTSLLYRCAEDMEYADLLDLAADRTDSIERMLYVAAFASSEYASSIGRVAKPFNPLLGETFEYVRPDKNYRFFIEQVSHHPPIGAAWAESPKWTYYGESAVKSKFYGKSFDIFHLGTWFLKLRPTAGGQEELYSWKKVTSTVVGIITGNPVVDNYGPMEVKNWTTGEVCHVEFKPRGWKQSSAYQLAGKIVDANSRVRVSLGGRWNSKIYARLTPGYEATVEEPADNESIHHGSISDASKAFLIWQANHRPSGIPFNLTPFAVTFNHLDDNLKPWLAPTDSRFRPDQRAMEDGEYDLAATEKNRLEEGQRARRREREARGEEFVPAWFTKARCEVTGVEYWQFNGRYWETRAKAGPEGDSKVWEGLEPIF